MENGSRYYRSLESVSIASALSSALTIYPCQIRVHQTLTLLNSNFLQLLQLLLLQRIRGITHYALYTLCPKKTCDYIFYNNFNNKCPITIIFGIDTRKSMSHRKKCSHMFFFGTQCRAGLVDEQAASRKLSKYAQLASDYILQLIAVESHGPYQSSTSSFLSNIGTKICASSREDKETSFLFQRYLSSLFLFNVSILCFCTTLSPRTVKTNSLPDLILICC